jgi:hypothetical protein
VSPSSCEAPPALYLILLKADGSGMDASIGNGFRLGAGALLRATGAPGHRKARSSSRGISTGAPQQVVVARYDSTFHLDTQFGTGGSTTFGLTHTSPVARGMTLQRVRQDRRDRRQPVVNGGSVHCAAHCRRRPRS